ncbi:hypothetical protein ACUWBI_004824, partial [Escherichia coli]
ESPADGLRGKTSIFSHPVYLFLREFSLQDSRGGSVQIVKQLLSRDPFECVLCGGRMVYRRAVAGLNVDGLKKNARDISLLRYIPV